MNSNLFSAAFFFVISLGCFSMTVYAEKAYLPEALKTVEQIKNQQGKIDGYRGNQYVPVIPGADLAKVGQGYELPNHLKPYEIKTPRGTVQFYKLPKSSEVPKSANFLPQLPEVPQDEKPASTSIGATSSGAAVTAGQGNTAAAKAVAPTSAKTSASQTNQTVAAKKKIGFWGF